MTQTTLAGEATLSGAALHSGATARVTLRPAPAGSGIRFRLWRAGQVAAVLPARWDLVTPVPLCTRLSDGRHSVSTVEHLMAALAGCGVHNALVEVTGPELPILDGSARPFVAEILRAGLRRQAAPLRALAIRRPVEVRDGPAWARLEPAEGPEIAVAIDFPDRAIGRQSRRLRLAGEAFLAELADSRTFCRAADVAAMRAAGLARGGTMENAIVVEGDAVLTPGGLRHPDEPVRHKMLDAVGDLALAGGPILGRYVAERPGHALTNRLLRALFAAPGAAVWVPCGPERRPLLPNLAPGRPALREVA